jgi:hypothetical protein
MRRLVIAVALPLFATVIVVLVLFWQDRASMPLPSIERALAGEQTSTGPAFASEHEWIAASVAGAIAEMARFPAGPAVERPTTITTAASETGATSGFAFVFSTPDLPAPVAFHVVDHIWSPATYADVAEKLLSGAAVSTSRTDESPDLDVRGRLTDLRVETMLEQNRRVSAALNADMRSPASHEAAALLVGSLALRETAGMFSDVRPALSRMTAHLTLAHVLRGPRRPSKDGALALAVLTALINRQREALEQVEAYAREAASAADRAWVQALRYRITGDWRTAPRGGATLIEQLEYARALRQRIGSDALLDFLDRSATGPEEIADWQRIALEIRPGIEAGNRFAADAIDGELTEARLVWSTFRGAPIAHEALVVQLNASAAHSAVQPAGGVEVLDWGLWAPFLQRHLTKSLTATSDHLRNLGRAEEYESLPDQFEKPFGRLKQYPIVLWWIASKPEHHDRGVAGVSALAKSTPELLTAGAWNSVTADKRFPQKPIGFPFEARWFAPAVPAGTAFDLAYRSLREGCPRPPTRAQAAGWAEARPYDSWTVWANEYLAIDGQPSLDAIRRALGPLLEYDAPALTRTLDYIDAPPEQHLSLARTLCEIAPSQCNVVGNLLLNSGRDAAAVAAYERWVAGSRDRVDVANGLTWLVRYYDETGKRERAEELARMTADTGSARGLETLAHLLDRAGRFEESEATYRSIAAHYRDSTSPLGTFFMRKAIRTGDKNLEKQAWELLRPAFPTGLEPVALHALPVRPTDGVRFQTFGARAGGIGLRPTDIIVGVDGWRVRDVRQFNLVSRFSHDPMMAIVVWRGGGYEQGSYRVPQRWLGVVFADSHGVPGA